MDAAGDQDAGNLDQLRDLCADLAGELGNGQLLAWAEASVPAAVPDVVFGALSDAGLLDDSKPAGTNPGRSPWLPAAGPPADPDELWSRMWEVDERAAMELLIGLEASSARDRSRRARRLWRYQQEPADILAELARLTGPDTRWWVNTDLTTWNPITQHTFDAVVVGAGSGIVVTLVAFEGG
jgi:hypothetical protein